MKTTIETLKGYFYNCSKEKAIFSHNGHFYGKGKENEIPGVNSIYIFKNKVSLQNKNQQGKFLGKINIPLEDIVFLD